jgi:hypothetical protein
MQKIGPTVEFLWEWTVQSRILYPVWRGFSYTKTIQKVSEKSESWRREQLPAEVSPNGTYQAGQSERLLWERTKILPVTLILKVEMQKHRNSIVLEKQCQEKVEGKKHYK